MDPQYIAHLTQHIAGRKSALSSAGGGSGTGKQVGDVSTYAPSPVTCSVSRAALSDAAAAAAGGGSAECGSRMSMRDADCAEQPGQTAISFATPTERAKRLDAIEAFGRQQQAAQAGSAASTETQAVAQDMCAFLQLRQLGHAGASTCVECDTCTALCSMHHNICSAVLQVTK